jgi:hypothetical protein
MSELCSKTFELINSIPSFNKGVGRIFDFHGDLDKDVYNKSETSLKADYKAINSDWMAVGEDMYGSLIDLLISSEYESARKPKRK